MFLGDDLLVWLTLAFGAAMAVGNGLALFKPRTNVADDEVERPPLGRSLVMILIGTVAAVWALVSLISG